MEALSIVPRHAVRRPTAPSRTGANSSMNLLALEFVCCLLVAAILLIVSSIWSSGIPAILAGFLYLWFQTIFFRAEPRGYALILPLMITTSSGIFSMVLIEQGARMPELAIYGSPGGYTIQYVLYDVLSIGSYIITHKLLVRAMGLRKGGQAHGNTHTRRIFSDKINALIIYGVIMAGLLCALLLVGYGLAKGFPVLSGTDRFALRRSLGNGPIVYILNLKSVLGFMLGFAAQVSRSKKVSAICTSLALFFLPIFFLFGDKFFTNLTFLATFAAPWLYANYRKVSKHVLTGLGIAFLCSAPMWAMTWAIYSDMGRFSNTETLNRFSGRIAAQGELWYVQSKIGARIFNFDETLVQKNISALFEKDANVYALQNSLGPNYYTDRYAPPDIAVSIHHNAGSVTYTAALEPLGLVMFGWGGLVIVKIICGVVTAIFALYMAWAIECRSLISGTFGIYLMTQLTGTLRQGTPWTVFSIFSLKWICFIIFVEIIFSIFLINQRRKSN